MTEFKIARCAGPQRGEQCKLLWCAVDLDGKRITGCRWGSRPLAFCFRPPMRYRF